MIDMSIVWLIGIAVFLILEAATYQMISIWFAAGALGGFIVSLCGGGFYIQMTVFLIITFVLILLVRPLSLKLVKPKNIRTNAGSLIGKTVLITQEVDNFKGTGQGKTEGMFWTIRSIDDEIIPEGELATVEEIQGVKLIVKGAVK